jgi:hypothetical protein
MKNFLSVVLLLSLPLFSLAGCAQARPEWIDNPGKGAVGSSPMHVFGKQAQEELAITRARIRLAARLGVVINSVQQIKETVTNDQGSVTSERKTTEEISQEAIRSVIQNIWHDLERDIIYALVIPIE